MSQNSQENTCTRSFPEAFSFIKKETLAQVFSCDFCEISKRTSAYRTPLVAAFNNSRWPELIWKVAALKFSKASSEGFRSGAYHSEPREKTNCVGNISVVYSLQLHQR